MEKSVENNNKIYLIGNGFDLHHNLNTKYSNFKEFLIKKDKTLVSQIDKIFHEKGYNSDEIEYWYTLEEMLEAISFLDEDELFQDAFDNSEMDMDRASYWHDPKYNADKKAEELLVPLEMKKYFDEWINSIDLIETKKDVEVKLPKESYYLNFNYTSTLQRVYEIPNEHVLHIHGRAGNKFILGHNGDKNLPYKGDLWNPYEDTDGETSSDEDIRTVEVKESINKTYLKLFKKYYKNSANIIKNNLGWFEMFKEATEVVIMGWSIGKEDAVYLREISKLVPLTCKFTIYYYKSKDAIARNIGKILNNFQIYYIEW